MSEQDWPLDEYSPEDSKDQSSEMVNTAIGKLPMGWQIEWVDDVCEINPDGFSEDDWPAETFEYITLSNVSHGRILESETTPVVEAPSRAQRQIREGDVLVGTVRPEQVSHGFVTEEHDDKICSSGFGVLRTSGAINSRYLIQEVLSRRFLQQMVAYMAGSGYPAINIGDLKRHRISVPPLEEQRKIATVLYNVDEAIQKTGEIIEQRERVRMGLQQDLFNRGLGEDENLRPIPSKAPSQYEKKHDRIIPSDWGVEKLADVGQWVSGNTPTRSESAFWGGTIPWITAKDMKNLYVEMSEDCITERAVEAGAKVVPADSVLVLVRGMILDNTLPVVRPMVDTSFNQDVKAILPHKSVDSDYLAYWLKTHTHEVLALVTSATHGTKRLSTESLGNLNVPIPSVDEQKALVERVKVMDELNLKNREYSEKLKLIKKGLMQDLLSGTIRTTGTNIEVLDEVLQHG